MKRVSFICVFIAAASLCIGVTYFYCLRLSIRTFENAFTNVRIGDSPEDVKKLLGAPYKTKRSDNLYKAVPRVTALYEGSQEACEFQYLYVKETFFLPLAWIVGFDANGTVVVKFRLD